MNYDIKVSKMIERYGFTEDQKVRFLARANEIVNSNISKDYKLGIIVAVAEYIAREKERKIEIQPELEARRKV